MVLIIMLVICNSIDKDRTSANAYVKLLFSAKVILSYCIIVMEYKFEYNTNYIVWKVDINNIKKNLSI